MIVSVKFTCISCNCAKPLIFMKPEVTSENDKAKVLIWLRLILRIDLYMDEGLKIDEISEFDLYSASTYRPANTLFRRICCGGSPPVKPNYTVICIGLSRSGKSSLLAKLSGESTDNIEPTIGFSIKALIFDNCFLDVKELGGADNVRPYWDRYYLGTQGIIFVVNSAGSEEEMNATKEEFRKAVENEQLEGFPLLVLCNHQDHEGARSTDEISKLLSLDKQTGERPWAIHSTSVQDKSSIKVGFEKLNKFLLEPYNPATNSKDGFDRL